MTLFRVELHRKQIVLCQRRVKWQTVIASCSNLAGIVSQNVETMHEIETTILWDIRPERMLVVMHLIPAHMRYF